MSTTLGASTRITTTMRSATSTQVQSTFPPTPRQSTSHNLQQLGHPQRQRQSQQQRQGQDRQIRPWQGQRSQGEEWQRKRDAARRASWRQKCRERRKALRTTSAPWRRLALLIKDAPESTPASLLAYVQNRDTFLAQFDPNTRTTHVVPNSVPWPALWLLLTYSGKFRLCSKAPPSVWATTDIQQFINKLHWKLHFRDHPSEHQKPLIYRKHTSYCNEFVHPDFIPWTRQLRRRFLNNLSRADPQYGQNISGLLKLALQYLRYLPYIYIRNDKDNGVTLLHKDRILVYTMLTLPHTIYWPIDLDTVNFATIRSRMRSLARRIAQQEQNPTWFRAIMELTG